MKIRSKNVRWQPSNSLRSQLNLFGFLLLLLTFGGGILVWAVLRNTETAIVSSSRAQISEAAAAIKNGMERRLAYLDKGNGASPMFTPRAETSRKLLTFVTEAALQSAVGVEGGFFVPWEGIVGYAYPTHEVGSKQDVPAAEKPYLEDLCRRAWAQRVAAEEQIFGRRDIIVLYAVPVQQEGHLAAVAWTMKRLPGLRSPQNRWLQTAVLSFGLLAILCLLGAFLLSRSLQRSISRLKSGLQAVQMDLHSRIQLQDTGEEFQEIADGINQLADKLQTTLMQEKRALEVAKSAERIAALGEVVAGVAHEVRNPMATIKLQTQMLQQNTGSETAKRQCAKILQEIKRLDEMVERLLLFGRAIAIQNSLFELNGLLREGVENFGLRYSNSGLRWITNLSANPLRIFSDRDKLAQVLDNLLQNAVEQYPDGKGEIVIQSFQKETGVGFSVEDRGPGISEEMSECIFEPFFTTKDGGTGLGLAICKEIIGTLGGTLQARNRPDGGACFTVTLPDGLTGGVRADS